MEVGNKEKIGHKKCDEIVNFVVWVFLFDRLSIKIGAAFHEGMGFRMNFFQKIGNGISRFMYGRNGADHLGLTMIWAAILLDVINMFIKHKAAHGVISIVAAIVSVWALWRMLSRNLYKRREENRKFMEKIWFPITKGFRTAKTQRMDKEHKYFTCTVCRTVCRVPKGKGKIVITCPKCGNQIHGKS